MSSAHANRYTPEFKQRAVQLYESRSPVTHAEVARELGIDAGTLSKWVAQARPGEEADESDNHLQMAERSGARSRLDAAFERAARTDPVLARKRCTPHTLRHSTAMAMLAAGVDISTIAIWLEHESVSTTHKYMVADMEMKERALERAAGKNPFGGERQARRYVPEPGLLAFLESL